MCFWSRDASLWTVAGALAVAGVGCSTPASMFARAAAAERERSAHVVRQAPSRSSATVPSWAIHVERPNVDVAETLEAQEARLIRELDTGTPAVVFVPPEQLGALAVRELQQGHFLDASALLALASFRRHQQADYAHDEGLSTGLAAAREQLRYGTSLNEEVYRKYVSQEADAFREARFDDEIDRIAVKQGAALDARSTQQDLMRLMMGNLNDSYAASRAFKERAAVQTAPAAEQIFHPRFVSAVHQFFASRGDVNGTADERHQAKVASQYLARVPVRAFRFSALQKVAAPFDGLVIRAGLSLYSQEPARVAELLRNMRGETRAQVAIILGLSGDITRIRELDLALADEPDPRVRLALEFALLRLGEQQHLAAVRAALRDQDPLVVEYALILVEWLPHDLESEFSEELLVEVLARSSVAKEMRLLAATVLCELAAKRPISEATLRLVLAVAAEFRDQPEQLEPFQRIFAELTQLDRARVLAEVRTSALREPWLARLARVAEPADLALLGTLFGSRAIRDRRMLVHVAASIPGEQAQSALQRWFADYPALRSGIAVNLILRADLDKGSLRKVMNRAGGAYQFMFALATGEASLKQASAYLASDDAEERRTAVLALKLFGSTLYRQLLWPNVSYHDDRYYPSEVGLRQLALGALIALELNRGDVVVVGAPAQSELALVTLPNGPSARVDVTEPRQLRLPGAPSELRLRPPAPAIQDPMSPAAIRATLALRRSVSGATAAGTTDTALESTAAERAPYLPPEQIQEVVAKNQGALRACYDNAASFGATLKGKVVMRWRVARSGRVVLARVEPSSTLRDSFLEECLVREVASWQFPKPDGGEVSVLFPFEFGVRGPR